MTTQKKCTISLLIICIIELLPVPITSVYAIYAMRKRPTWLLGVINRLYSDPPLELEKQARFVSVEGHDFMKTRRNCTIGIISLFVVDLIVPVIIPIGIFVVRKRPVWFKNLANRLYADKVQNITLDVAIQT